MKKILVLGSTGRIGAEVTRAFAKADWSVVAQRRGKTAAGSLVGMPSVEWLSADLGECERIAEQAKGAQYVFYGLNPKTYTATAWRKEAIPMLEAGIQIAEQLGARLLFPGNVYNFGANMPQSLRPETPQRPSTDKGRIRVEMEAMIATAVSKGRIKATLLRAGDYWGSGEGTLFGLVIAKSLAMGKVTLLSREAITTPWAYLPDFAMTFLHVATAINNGHEVQDFDQHHFAGHQLSGKSWVTALQDYARAVGIIQPNRELSIGYFPWRLIRALGLFVPTCRSVANMQYLWATPHQLDNQSLLALIGQEPHTPLPAAIRASADQYLRGDR